MATIDNLIKVQISNQTQAVSTESFGVPLILGPTDAGWAAGDLVHSYSEPASMLEDGFTAESPEYVMAQTMYEQTITPTNFLVGQRMGGPAVAELANHSAQNDTWYCLLLAGATDDDILSFADAIEPLEKVFLVSTNTAAVATQATDDVASRLKAKGYTRTALIYTQNLGNTVEAAWVGSQLPQTPGSNNWAYKNLTGVSADALNGNQLSILYGSPIAGQAGKNVNVYTTVGGIGITFPGMMASGQYIDITIGLDWLQSTLRTALFTMLQQATKVPYTDAGASMLMSAVRGVLAQAETNGLIDGSDPSFPVSVTCPAVADVPAAQRANRIAPTITFQARLQGAFNSVSIVGTISI